VASLRSVTAGIGVIAACGVVAAILPAQAEEPEETSSTMRFAAKSGLAPTAVDDLATVTENSYVRIRVLHNDSDAEDDPLSVAEIIAQPANGTANIHNNRIRYWPLGGFLGQDTLTYRVSDGTSTADAAVTIDVVADTNQQPVAATDTGATKWQTPLRLNVLSNDTDPDGDALTVSTVTQPQRGSAEIVRDGAAIRFSPEGQFVGDSTFDYEISDGRGGTDTESVTVSIAPLYAVSLLRPKKTAALAKASIAGKVTSRMNGPVRVVVQQRAAGGRWKALRDTRVDADDRFDVRWSTGQPGRERFRARATWDDGRKATSRVMRVHVVPTFNPDVSTITKRDVPKTWRSGCPVHPSSLRKIRMNYWDYRMKLQRGTLIGASWAAADYVYFFRRAFESRFQIKKMYPADRYGGVDERAMRAGNTSAFNCRHVTGNPYRMSRHSWGDAIDINTFENPYVTGSRVYPAAAAGPYYYRRSQNLHDPGVITRNSSIARALFSRNWYWGARWAAPDYQHWSKTGG